MLRLSTVTFDTLDTLDTTRRPRDAQSNLVTPEHIDSRMASVDAKFDKLTWMMGVLIALSAANFAKQFFEAT